MRIKKAENYLEMRWIPLWWNLLASNSQMFKMVLGWLVFYTSNLILSITKNKISMFL